MKQKFTETLGRFFTWLLQKLLWVGILTALGIFLVGLSIFLWEKKAVELERVKKISSLQKNVNQLQAELLSLDERVAALQTDASVHQNRAEQAAKVAHSLEELGSGIDRLLT